MKKNKERNDKKEKNIWITCDSDIWKIKTKERKFKVNMERFMGGKDGKISGTLSEVQIWYQILIIFNIF